MSFKSSFETEFEENIAIFRNPLFDSLYQSDRSPKEVAHFSATNFSSYIIELLQLYYTIQIEWNYA